MSNFHRWVLVSPTSHCSSSAIKTEPKFSPWTRPSVNATKNPGQESMTVAISGSTSMNLPWDCDCRYRNPQTLMLPCRWDCFQYTLHLIQLTMVVWLMSMKFIEAKKSPAAFRIDALFKSRTPYFNKINKTLKNTMLRQNQGSWDRFILNKCFNHSSLIRLKRVALCGI